MIKSESVENWKCQMIHPIYDEKWKCQMTILLECLLWCRKYWNYVICAYLSRQAPNFGATLSGATYLIATSLYSNSFSQKAIFWCFKREAFLSNFRSTSKKQETKFVSFMFNLIYEHFYSHTKVTFYDIYAVECWVYRTMSMALYNQILWQMLNWY